MNRFNLHLFILVSFATALIGCGGNPSPSITPLQLLPGQAAPGGLGPAGGAVEPPAPRGVKQEEFAIVLIADERVRELVSVPVHIISADEDTAGRLAALKAADYWQSPYSGAVVITETFGQRGTNQRTVRVPSVPAKDFIVLAADLAAPPGGRDDRILRVPLKLDYTDPANPVARPIRIRLTPSGWQREN